MTGTELRAALARLNLSPEDFSKIVGRTWRSVERWLSSAPDPRTGKPTPIPGYVALYIEQERVRQQQEATSCRHD